ncbi:MAG TPA: DUF1207 domain-containing protein [Lacipirellulaceae bacterium]|nr:DUF1207 domain-containing protein [Lacipirellulaceae bacterium]
MKKRCALLLACVAVFDAARAILAQELLPETPAPAPATAAVPFNGDEYGALFGQPPIPTPTPSGAWIAPPGAQPLLAAPAPCNVAPAWGQPVIAAGPNDWYWQVMPKSVIYHSYLAGVHEPRLGIIAERETNSDHSFWDGTLGARVGVLRYGTGDGIMPQGFELDVEAAAMVRLTLDSIGDFETADYRYGVPLTYGIDNWQFKLAAYHLSSHLGDEFAIAHPGSLDDRINYVRNELVLGASYFPQPFVRLYGEAGWCFHYDGGAEPWEFQFGTELSQPGPTGPRGTPFLAVNANLRQEVDFGGDISTEAGWLWRNDTGQVMRLGLHYFNGKSSQFQTFNNFEQQIGFGLWYDF